MVAGLVSRVVHRIQLSEELEVCSFLMVVSVSSHPQVSQNNRLTIIFWVFSSIFFARSSILLVFSSILRAVSWILCCIDVYPMN